MKLPKSKIGWTFVAIYLVIAGCLVYEALTCVGFVCDLIEFPAAVPFGLLYLVLLNWLNPVFVFGSITYDPFRNWFFIIPTLVGNSVIFYWLGVGLGKSWKRLVRRTSA